MTRSAPTRLQKPPVSAPASGSGVPGLLARPGFFILAALCLAAAVFAVYAPALHFQFVVDDHYILGDPRITSPGHVWDYFANYVWAEYAGGPAIFYRPLFILWLRTSFILSGMSPWGWHLLSTAKHVVVAVLLGLLAWKLLRDRLAALLAATLFALHPAQVESVAWVTVPDPLMAAGVLCTVLLYLRYARGFPESRVPDRKPRNGTRAMAAPQPSVLWLMASAAVCFATLLVKEVAVLLPVVLFALALFQPRVQPAAPPFSKVADFKSRLARALRQIVPFACVTVLYLVIRLQALGGKLATQTEHFSWTAVILSWPATLWFFVKVMFWPVQSHSFADPILAEKFSVRGVLLPGLGVACVTALLVAGLLWAWRRAGRVLSSEDAIGVRYALLLGVLLLVLPILPTLDLNVLGPGNALHGRYTYLSLCGLMLLVATALRLTGKFRMPLVCAGGLLAIAFAAWTLQQERQWRNDLTVLTVAHQLAPHNLRVAHAYADARVHLALQLTSDGQYTDALPILHQVTAEFPQDWFAWAALADCYYHLNNLADAEKSLHRAADLSHKPQVIQQWQELRAQMGLPRSVPPQ